MVTMTNTAESSLKLVHSKSMRESLKPSVRRRVSFQEQEMRLLERLQTSLDIETLIEIFYQETAAMVPYDGVTYSHNILDINCDMGSRSAHSAGYSLKLEGKYLGDLTFNRRKRFDENELSKIEILLTSMVYPMKNALQYREAINSAFTDPLTKAQNRAAMSEALNREVELAKRHGDDLSVILMDADLFKSINDIYGHSHGDNVLRTIADITRETIRQSDVLYRYGGEEFLVMLNHTDIEGAKGLAERIRKNIANIAEIDNIKSDVTVSLGVTNLNNEDCCMSIFDRADRALYQAKRGGRNRTVTITESN